MLLFFIAILFSLAVTAQDAAPQTPEQLLRRVIRQSENLTQTEKTLLMSRVRQYPNQCVLSSTLAPQKDRSRLLIAIAISTANDRKGRARELLAELIETKVNTLLCDTVLDQLGLYSARRPRYDRVMGMMLAYSMPADFTEKAITETVMDGMSVLSARLNDHDILRQFHEQGPAADPTAIATNRNRLRNAVVKQISRETLGFLQQGKSNPERLQDARRCVDELNKIQKTQQERFPDDTAVSSSTWNAKPVKEAAIYCLLLAGEQSDAAQEAINEAFFAMSDSISQLPTPWFDIVREYAIKYHRKQDYDFLMSNAN